MSDSEIKMVITDLDGTLLNSSYQICPRDLITLQNLGRRNIYRIIATGRSIFSLRRVITADFPLDYVIFSSGAGVMNWHSKEIINKNSLTGAQVAQISDILHKHELDFMVHDPIPDNHRFSYIRNGKRNADFDRRISHYRDFARATTIANMKAKPAGQIVGIIPGDLAIFHTVKEQLTDLKVIRATSPFDHQSIWIEIFPQGVSKGHTAQWLAQRLKVDRSQTVGIGNDYNDLDFLSWVKHSFVVANAAKELKQRFQLTASNERNGFTQALQSLGII